MAKSSKVMLVEDDSTMLSVLKTLLELEGYQVLIAPERKRLQDIVQSIEEASPDTLLLDVHLREISGYDILQRLRASGKVSQMRVIMSSGMDVKDRCMAAGADNFLMKPYMPDELLDMLQG